MGQSTRTTRSSTRRSQNGERRPAVILVAADTFPLRQLIATRPSTSTAHDTFHRALDDALRGEDSWGVLWKWDGAGSGCAGTVSADVSMLPAILTRTQGVHLLRRHYTNVHGVGERMRTTARKWWV